MALMFLNEISMGLARYAAALTAFILLTIIIMVTGIMVTGIVGSVINRITVTSWI
ncbi:hypothetical protein XNW1_4410015 [Xenorhabdus nematophila str. Websteri]|nr:hypothetical protein XNW1_4410015 [Xenorhabdus nematophila str. Websteri]